MKGFCITFFVFVSFSILVHASPAPSPSPTVSEFVSSAADLIHVLDSATVRDELKESGQIMQIRLINNGFHMGYQLITEKCQMDVMIVKSIEDRNNQIVALPKECRH
ncbi:MAG: hypothetical protein FMNOHCHN_03611 [Ignavibacteriaceae bacterium]|nr:hypothetical protein [Ignavibacteriaceae bacterium]